MFGLSYVYFYSNEMFESSLFSILFYVATSPPKYNCNNNSSGVSRIIFRISSYTSHPFIFNFLFPSALSLSRSFFSLSFSLHLICLLCINLFYPYHNSAYSCLTYPSLPLSLLPSFSLASSLLRSSPSTSLSLQLSVPHKRSPGLPNVAELNESGSLSLPVSIIIASFNL